MNLLRLNPVSNPFALKALEAEIRQELARLRTSLEPYNIEQSNLDGQIVPCIVRAIYSHVDALHSQIAQDILDSEGADLSDSGVGAMERDLLKQDFPISDFITRDLKQEFLKVMPPYAIDEESLIINPLVTILTLTILDKFLRRHLVTLNSETDDYNRRVKNTIDDSCFSMGKIYIESAFNLFKRRNTPSDIGRPEWETLHEFVNVLRSNAIPFNATTALDRPQSLDESIFISLRDCMLKIRQGVFSSFRPSNDKV